MAKRNYSKIGAKNVYYNGNLLNDTFIVDEIYLESFPEATDTTVDIPGIPGSKLVGVHRQPRHGSMRLSLNTEERQYIDAFDAFKRLADMFDFETARVLDFGHFRVNAKCTKASDFEQVGIYLSTTLEFVCYDPHLYYRDIEIELTTTKGTFYNQSTCPVWPVIEVTGASVPLTITNKDTGEKVTISSGITSTTKVTVDMAKARCYANTNYLPANMDLTDFFSLAPGTCNIGISSGKGTLRYTECRL